MGKFSQVLVIHGGVNQDRIRDPLLPENPSPVNPVLSEPGFFSAICQLAHERREFFKIDWFREDVVDHV